MQLASIEGAPRRAPEGEHDDRADIYALALVAAVKARRELGDVDAEPEVFGGGYRGWR